LSSFIYTDRKRTSYTRDYVVIANLIALGIVPLVILVVLNSLIFREISRATCLHNAISTHQRRNHSVAKMLIVVVAVFIICHSVR
jgi:hypothetical protein